MEDDVVEKLIVVQRLLIPHRPIHRVLIELEDRICSLFSREDVLCEHVRDIKYDPHIFDIWHTLSRDMMTLIHLVVSSLMLIQIL